MLRFQQFPLLGMLPHVPGCFHLTWRSFSNSLRKGNQYRRSNLRSADSSAVNSLANLCISPGVA